jgi:hypothetical protein
LSNKQIGRKHDDVEPDKEEDCRRPTSGSRPITPKLAVENFEQVAAADLTACIAAARGSH